MKIYILWEITTSYDFLGSDLPSVYKNIYLLSNNFTYLQLEKEKAIRLFEESYEKQIKSKPKESDIPEYEIEELHSNQVHLIL